jgi:hypothetical protein
LYGEIPPVQVTVAVTVALCPESIAVGERVRAGARPEVTVTATDAQELADGVPVLLSVTRTEKSVFDVTVVS